ncbi:MAG: EAL domain-containing protein [Leptolyngbyaceae cyanobacterium]
MLRSRTPALETTVLVIDDDENLAKVFCKALNLNGFDVLMASTGQKALQMARLHRPQLIVCDIGLPDLSGYDVLKRLRLHPQTLAIPVIMITGRADTFRRSMEHGADDYLSKPVDTRSFLRAVQTQLTKRKQLAQHFALSSNGSIYEPLFPVAHWQELEEQFERIKLASWSSLWMVRLANYGSLYANYGHVFSQLVLQSMGQQLYQWQESQLDFHITWSYLGEDRFIVFLDAPNLSAEEGVQSAIANLKTDLQQPIIVNNHRLTLDINIESIGYQELTGVQTLTTVLPAPVLNQPSLAEQLRQAISRDELQLYFQPQVDLTSGQIIGAEALVRWHLPGKAQILPAQFIPVAEENGLMLPLGEWILETALQQLAYWQKTQCSDISIAINLSGYQLRSPHFIEQLMTLVDRAGVSPIMIDLELPERLILEDLGQAKFLLTALQNRGFSTAIDDFGSGCLSHLQYLPINILKLDKCFVRDLHQNRSNQVIVSAIMEMARGLNISTIANGVETARELSVLKQLKCQSMQGYLFSPAIKAEDFGKLLLESSKKQSVLLDRQEPNSPCLSPR